MGLDGVLDGELVELELAATALNSDGVGSYSPIHTNEPGSRAASRACSSGEQAGPPLPVVVDGAVDDHRRLAYTGGVADVAVGERVMHLVRRRR